jgi:hypothetical protein
LTHDIEHVEVFRERLAFLAGVSYGLTPEEAAGPVSVALERWRAAGGSKGGLPGLVNEFHLACREFLADRGGAWPAGPPTAPPVPGSAAPLAVLIRRPGAVPVLHALGRLGPEARAALHRFIRTLPPPESAD